MLLTYYYMWYSLSRQLVCVKIEQIIFELLVIEQIKLVVKLKNHDVESAVKKYISITYTARFFFIIFRS